MFLTRIRLVNKLPYCASSFIQYLFYEYETQTYPPCTCRRDPFQQMKKLHVKEKKISMIIIKYNHIIRKKNKTHLDKQNVYNNDNNKSDIVD